MNVKRAINVRLAGIEYTLDEQEDCWIACFEHCFHQYLAYLVRGRGILQHLYRWRVGNLQLGSGQDAQVTELDEEAASSQVQ